ncbi:lysozyme inhibitor LprI family protein [Burkholderia arboris]|uniref:lysozyme inhibitor LprI family protein n=1 Tax=Burkholderia arboris TaxID=488730 RepID=UPI00158348D7|nr:hypothetical protein [Burkholderia arboris]
MSKVLVVFLFFISLPVVRAGELPGGLIGKWEVVEIHVNKNFGGRVNYGWDDPRLKWRLFNFSSIEISNNTPEDETNCVTPEISPEDVNFDDFLRVYLGGYGKSSSRSPTKDYELGVAGNTNVQVMHVLCGQKHWNGLLGGIYDNDRDNNGSWLLMMSKQRVLLSWYDETILVLSKIASGAKPSPSFACSKATLPTEWAICGSFELAGFDKSVDSAYRVALRDAQQSSESIVDIQRQQRAWLKERNRCGSNSNCIQAAMKKQLDGYRAAYLMESR